MIVGDATRGFLFPGSGPVRVSPGTEVTLQAIPFAGWRSALWADPLACRLARDTCVLETVVSDTPVDIGWDTVGRYLTVAAGVGGSVRMQVDARPALVITDSNSLNIALTTEDTVTLTAQPADGYRFSDWKLSSSLACAEGPTTGATCTIDANLVAAASAAAAFNLAPHTLTVSAGANGSVSVVVNSTGAVVVNAGTSMAFTATVADAVTLTATPAAGYALDGWTLSGGLPNGFSCSTTTCALAAGSITGDASARATFGRVASTLTVSAGANGSVSVVVNSTGAVVVNAGTSMAFTATVADAVTLTAMPSANYNFASWALGGLSGVSCSAATCTLAAGSITGDASAGATFDVADSTLTVSAGANGSVSVVVNSTGAVVVNAGTSMAFTATVADAVTLTATPATGYAFARWTLSGGLPNGFSCSATTCTLAAGSITGDASAGAFFGRPVSTLTVSAGANGSVSVVVNSTGAVVVNAGTSMAFTATVADAVTLTAMPSANYNFASWALGGLSGVSCSATTCTLAAGSITGDASAGATFDVADSTLTVSAGANGSVSVVVNSTGAVVVNAGTSMAFTATVADAVTLTAAPATGYAFARWTLSGGLPNGFSCSATTCALAAGSITGDASAGATFDVADSTLTVSAGANGSVSVVVNSTGAVVVNAGTSMAFTATVADAVTLTAAPATGYAFARWTLSGGLPNGFSCSATTCALAAGSITGDASAGAFFGRPVSTLTVSAGANGSVSVVVNSTGAVVVNAGTSMAFTATVADAVTLTAMPSANYNFASWALGGLSGVSCSAATCTLAAGSITGDASAGATFDVADSTLTVSAGANGSVSVVVNSTGAVVVDAGTSMAFTATVEDSVTLTAMPSANYNFASWALGGLSGVSCSAATCTLAAGSITGDASAGASFVAITRTLTVSAGANGSVSVVVNSTGAVVVNAGTSMAFTATVADAVTLTAMPSANYNFASWALGGLSGVSCSAATCTLAAGSITGDASAGASFVAITRTLTVSAGANGSVSVVVNSTGAVVVNAGTSMAFTATVADAVTLTATPAAGYALARWTLSGGLPNGFSCSTTTCALAAGSITGDASAGAFFGRPVSTLTVSAGANGSVSVVVNSTGAVVVDAGTSMAFAATVEDSVTLTAMPSANYNFASWALGGLSGVSCSATTCTLAAGSITGDASAGASFVAITRTLTVSAGANGSVSVVVNSTGAVVVNAGTSMAFTATVADAVTLTAMPSANYNFASWALGGLSGVSCSATTCTLAAGSITGDASAGAFFGRPVSTLTVSAGANGSVSVVVNSTGAVVVNAGTSMAFTATVEDSVTLTAMPSANYNFASWALGGLSGVSCSAATCTLAAGSITGDASAGASFVAITRTLTVSAGANGSVSVVVNSTGAVVVNAGTSMAFTATVADAVALTAMPSANYNFASWALGGLSGVSCSAATCTLAAGSITGDASAGASFVAITRTLTVSAGANGSVSVVVNSTGAVVVNAGTSMAFTATVADAVTLTAMPSANYNFASWALGGLSGVSCSATTCTLAAGSITGDASAGAFFGRPVSTLTVSAGANGSVSVVVNSTGAVVVDAGTSMAFAATVEDSVTLTAMPSANYNFASWALGGLSGVSCSAATCTLAAGSITGDASAGASFVAVTRTLTVSAGANGSVSVVVNSTGAVVVNAGTSMAFTATVADAVTLTAMPSANYNFASWALGGLSGVSCSAATCTLAAGSITGDASAGAFFGRPVSTLTVSAGANGSVSVVVNSTGAVVVDAGTSMAFAATVEDSVTLTAMPSANYNFASWALGGLSGVSCSAATCTLAAGSITGDASAGASFVAVTRTLTVSAGANGSVSVVVNSTGAVVVNAGTSMAFTATVADAVTLTAMPSANYNFASWALGGLSGVSCSAATCTLAAGSITGDASAGAFFGRPVSTLTVSAGANGSVSVVVNSTGAVVVDAGTSMAFAATVEDSVTLTAMPSANYNFASWALGGLSGVSCSATTCTLAAGSITGDASAGASFVAITRTLTVSAGAGGSVRVRVAAAAAVVVNAATSMAFTATVADAVALTARPSANYNFAGWTFSGLSGGAPCAAAACTLPAGSITGDASADADFAPITRTLTVAAGANGSVSVVVNSTAAVTVDAGASMIFAATVADTVTLTATPVAGHRLGRWDLSGSLSGALCNALPARVTCTLPAGSIVGNATVEASFWVITHFLTVVAGAGGSVSVVGNSAPVVTINAESSRRLLVSEAATATLTADPSNHYMLSHWTLSGGVPPGFECPDARCVLEAFSITDDVTAQANFAPITRTLTVSAGANGSVSVVVNSTGAVVVNAATSMNFSVTVADTVTLTATPATGYMFPGDWMFSGNMLLTAASCGARCVLPAGYITVDSIADAVFDLAESALTVSAGANGSVSVVVNSTAAVVVNAGASMGFATTVADAVTLTAMPSAHYNFASWTLSGELSGGPSCPGATCTLPAGSITGEASADANFTPTPYNLTVTARPHGSVSVVVGGARSTVDAGTSMNFPATVEDQVALTAVPDDGYAFIVGWMLSPGLSCSGASCTLPAGSITGDASATATFDLLESTLTVSAGANGSVSVVVNSTGAVVVDAGTSMAFAATVEDSVTLTATPATGHAFADWALDGLPRVPSCPVAICSLLVGSIIGDARADANFIPIPYNLAVSAGVNGSVSVAVGASAPATIHAGASRDFVATMADAVTLTAMPVAGYQSTGWVLDGLSGEPSCPVAICSLPVGSIIGDATASVSFEAITRTLTVSTNPGGSVHVVIGSSSPVTVHAGTRTRFVVTVEDVIITLTGEAQANYRFDGWTVSEPSVDCGASSFCAIAGEDINIHGSGITARFEPLVHTLSLAAGEGGEASIALSGRGSITATVDMPTSIEAIVEDTVTLTATPDKGFAFVSWNLSGSLMPCAALVSTCTLPAGSITGDGSATARFVIEVYTLTASIDGDNGEMLVTVNDDDPIFVASGSTANINVTVKDEVALAATPDQYYEFAIWALAGDIECAEGVSDNPAACTIATGSIDENVFAAARFVATQRVIQASVDGSNNGNGSVSVSVGGGSPTTFKTGNPFAVTATVEDTVTLTAVPDPNYVFVGWTLSGSVSCLAGLRDVLCYIDVGSVTADGEAIAKFRVASFAVSWRGPGAVAYDGATATAVPYVPTAFDSWTEGPCVGSSEPACDVSTAIGNAVAEFLPFAADGVKSLAFGLGYDIVPQPNHYRVSSQVGSASATPLPGLVRLAAGPAFTRLLLPSLLTVPWGGSYLTESCSAIATCAAAPGGQATARDQLTRAIGYFKPGNDNAATEFGAALALSANGDTMAVGAPGDGSAISGIFVPSDTGYAAALADNSAAAAGAVYIYQRGSGGQWSLEAYVKAPRADDGDRFGSALALSADGDTLAVGARHEAGNFPGIFSRIFVSTEGVYTVVLGNNNALSAGAVYVYQRTSAAEWSSPTFIKAPNAGTNDRFAGVTLALSANGGTLAVGAHFEDSGDPVGSSAVTSVDRFAGILVPGGPGYDAINGNASVDSGAAYVYQRASNGEWSFEALFKPPLNRAGLGFGRSVALSANGRTLAVSSLRDDSSFTGAFHPGTANHVAALTDTGALDSGAAHVYRRSSVGQWSAEAFIKPSFAGAGDLFGAAVALSSSGNTLAVGARREDSSFLGVFAPDDTGYAAALADAGAPNSGAAYTYQRSAADQWSLEAFVKAPNTNAADDFGFSLDLSPDGDTLAVGASLRDGPTAGVFRRGDPGYEDALIVVGAPSLNHGAIYVYRASSTGWLVDAYVTPPDAESKFGHAVALSTDGAVLAAGAPRERAGAQSMPTAWGSRSSNAGGLQHGAVYLY